jgi:hypothetical protein
MIPACGQRKNLEDENRTSALGKNRRAERRTSLGLKEKRRGINPGVSLFRCS